MCRHLLFLYFHFSCLCFFLFFFNDTATTEIYTLSLHDALPICLVKSPKHSRFHLSPFLGIDRELPIWRLNSASFRRGPPQTPMAPPTNCATHCSAGELGESVLWNSRPLTLQKVLLNRVSEKISVRVIFCGRNEREKRLYYM